MCSCGGKQTTCLMLSSRLLVFEQHVGVAAHDGERGAQFVRGDGDEIAFGLVETLQVVVGLVEIAVGLAQLVVEFEQVFHETRILERDGRLVGKRADRDEVRIAEALGGEFRAECQQSDPAAVGEDRRVDFGIEAVEPLAFERGNILEFGKQVEVKLRKRLPVPRQVLGDGAVLVQQERQDLTLAVGAGRAQVVDAASAGGCLGVHEEEEAALEFHRFDDDANRHTGEALHIQDVADGFAVLM